MKKLAICWPMGNDFVPTRFFETAINLQMPDGYEAKWFRCRGWCSARRHNHGLEQAIGWGADYICFLDADQAYHTPDMLKRLLDRMKDDDWRAITALVPIRGHVGGQGTKPFQPIVWRNRRDENGNQIPAKDPYDVDIVSPDMGDFVRVDGCGSGVLLFPTEALKHLPPPWFTEIPSGNGFERISCTDWPFVNRLQREAELQIWCDTTIKVTHLQMFEIDETFSERFADWSEAGKGDPSTCEYNAKPRRGGEIMQARVSPSIPHYREKFLKRYELNDYSSTVTPAFFFGCYTKQDLDLINNHGSDAVLIWAGSDAKALHEAFVANPNARNPFRGTVRHVAISRFISDDLKAMGIPHTRVPFCNVDESKFKPTPRGKAVYVYLPDHSRDKYGGKMVDAVRAALPDVEFIVQSKLDPSADMPGLYARCGIGLRLLEHDGLSNTVVELGLAGRRCVWNGDAPNAMPYGSVEDVVRLIRHELSRDDDGEEVAADMAQYVKLPQKWKTVEFYNKPIGIIPPEVAGKPYEYDTYFDARYRSGARGAGGPDPQSNEAKWTQEVVTGFVVENGCESVVEVGCGAAVRWDALPCGDYTGIDVSAEALKHAAKKFPDATWLLRDITKDSHIPYGDAVIALDILQHIKPEDYDKTLANLFEHANKVLIIKTSVGINELSYQFDHGAPPAADGWGVRMIKVPDSAPSFMFLFTKQLQEAAV